MADKPANWMNQAGELYKQWADQQQSLFRSMAGNAGLFGIGGVNAARPPVNAAVDATADATEPLRKAQALWQSSMQQWVDLAQKAMPQAGLTGESLKALLDPRQWAHAGLGPLDAAIEHLVEGPSYATLWTLDRKLMKAQKLRAEWAKDRSDARVAREAAMAKLYATEAAQQVIDSALQLFGGVGVVAGTAVERLYREIRALRIYEGTSEIQKLVIAGSLIKEAA